MVEVLERIEAKVRARPELTSAEIVWTLVPRLRADAASVYRLFEELIENGLRYNRSEVPRVEVIGEEQPDGWRVEITDNGTGLPLDVRRRLGSDSTNETPQSGGLGRVIQILEELGSELAVVATGSAGTTVRITFPSELAD